MVHRRSSEVGSSPNGQDSRAEPGLGTYARYLDSGSERAPESRHQEERRRLFHLQRVAADLAPEERVRNCRWAVVSKAAGVGVVLSRYQREAKGKVEWTERASFTGLQTCGSVWLCPCCAKRVAEVRRGELNDLLSWGRSEGFYPLMLTLTARHTLADDLGGQLTAMKGAWERFQQRQEWRRLAPYIEGDVVVTEVKRSKRNGWHTHFHILILVRPYNLRALIGEARWLRNEARAATEACGRAVNAARAVEHLAKTEIRRVARREARRAERHAAKTWKAAAEASQLARQVRQELRALRALEGAVSDAGGAQERRDALEEFNEAVQARACGLFEPWISRVWQVCLAAFGLTASDERGATVQGATRVGDYLAKWGLSEELTLSHAKTGRIGEPEDLRGLTPLQLLADADAGSDEAGAHWQTYAREFKGRRQMVWSTGLKIRAGIGEVEDEDAAKDLDQGQERLEVGAIAYGQWRGSKAWLGARYRRGRILDAVEKDGAEGLARVVADGLRDGCKPEDSSAGQVIEASEVASEPAPFVVTSPPAPLEHQQRRRSPEEDFREAQALADVDRLLAEVDAHIERQMAQEAVDNLWPGALDSDKNGTEQNCFVPFR